MFTENFSYSHKDQNFNGYLSYPKDGKKKPAVLVAHDWSGQNKFAREKADWLATLGYVGFAVDMFGEGRTGKTNEEKTALIKPLLEKRQIISERMVAAFTAVSHLPMVNKDKIAAIGFCFGGLCVLDLARSGANLSAVVSFHGLLSKPENETKKDIKAKVLVLHGYEDPMVKPADVENFCDEMTMAKVDWQVHMYGQTQHSFTNPEAHDNSNGLIYNSTAEKRAFQSMQDFLTEVFY